MSIIPIPSTRVSSQMVGQRLTSQLNGDQIAILRLQNQIATGQRISLPSEDPLPALRAIGLQGLLERKAQAKSNLQTNQTYLSATDTALASASNLLNDARATALGAAGTTVSDEQRSAAATEIGRALEQLVNVGNQKYRGRYLFAGTATDLPPLDLLNGLVEYRGNESAYQSFSDLATLFESNVTAQQAFGAISEPVRGSVDLNPRLTADVKLKDLNHGAGIRLGSVQIHDGTNSSVVDLSGSETVGDIVAKLQAGAPTGRTLTVEVTGNGLTVSLDASGGGSLTIKEVAGGAAAGDLGILREVGSGTSVTGTDLNPLVTLTSPLADLLGTRAFTTVNSTGVDNNLRFEAVARGPAYNGVTVQFVDNGAVTAGHETVAYSSGTNTLTFQIDAGNTTANQIASALSLDPVAGLVFRASIIGDDSTDMADAGTGAVEVAATGVTATGSGIEPDLASGLQVVNGGETYTLDLSAANTVEDLLNVLNGSAAGLVAHINSAGTGIDIRSRRSGGDFSIGENGGTTATDLGLRTFIGGTRLSDLNHGVGIHENTGNDFIIRRKDGTQLTFDVSGLQTIDAVINAINTHASNLNPATKVTARLAANGNGIELTTSDTATTAQFAVLKVNNSQAAEDLGLIPVGQAQSAAPVAGGGVETITGRDTNPTEVEGLFNSLVRLQRSLETNDQLGLQRALAGLDANALRLNSSRAEVGARQQGLDQILARNDDEVVELKSVLSQEIETDFAKASIDLVARQTSFQASLQVAGQLAKLSLLDYL